MGIQTSLDEFQQTTRIIDAMRSADELAFAASRDSGIRTVRVLAQVARGEDQLAAIAAVHALARVIDDEAAIVLADLLSSDRAFLREHAAWAFGSRLPRLTAVARLVGMVVVGGFGGMIAQRTLQQWAVSAPDTLAVSLETCLLGVTESAARVRVTETLGLIPGPVAIVSLGRIARALDEVDDVRVAAIAALGDRAGHHDTVDLVASLAGAAGYIGDVARLALADLTASPGERAPWQTGITVAQLFLHADIDATLAHAGSGDTGGIATLLVRLGDALTEGSAHDTSAVQRVLTLSRGSAHDAFDSLSRAGATVSGHTYTSVPLLSEPRASADAWPLRVATERGIRRILRAAGTVDVLHLRMADVGSLAAASVARDLGIPVVFTVAPDPHALIHSLDTAGVLTRQNFGDIDEREHYWFRARLVQRLAADSDHTVLFPRPDLAKDMRELVGIDITAHPERHSVVPEGIDLDVVDRAVEAATVLVATGEATAELRDLRSLLETLPRERRGLPLLLSVGRMHRVKGMAAIVEAWSASGLRERANLLIVGGDLEKPSVDEQEQLDRIDLAVPASGRTVAGLLLPGHQPNNTVAAWMAATRTGVPGLASPSGIYICGSVKEEFGIALLEAMASGLMVVAPAGGGPSTYVEEGVTGFLTNTQSEMLLARAMADAFEAASGEMTPTRAELSRSTVESSFTIQAMAEALTAVYAGVGSATAGFDPQSATSR